MSQADNNLRDLIRAKCREGAPEAEIKALIDQMDNINSVGYDDDDYLLEILLNDYNHHNKNELVHYVVEKGANVNYAPIGWFNCLYRVWWSGDYDLMKYILDKGANPNCIYLEPQMTLLEWAEYELWQLKRRDDAGEEIRSMIERWDNLIALLKSYGAVSYNDLGGHAQVFKLIYPVQN